MKLGIKDRITSLRKKLRFDVKKSLRGAVDYALAFSLVCVCALGALKLPEVHDKYIRAAVGSKVYMLRDSEQSGGGTGFAVVAPSGESYILTNDHVCGVSKDYESLLVTDEAGDSIRRRIIAHDGDSDLCLVEGWPGVKGLSLGSKPHVGDVIETVGHPHLMPLHVSSGEITGSHDVSVMMGPISFIDPMTGETTLVPPEKGGIPAEQCSMHKHSQVDIKLDAGFFIIPVKVCIVTVHDAYQASAIIYPGNSGSPVVNFWGHVIGVAFASDETHWGSIVPLQDIQSFLKNF